MIEFKYLSKKKVNLELEYYFAKPFLHMSLRNISDFKMIYAFTDHVIQLNKPRTNDWITCKANYGGFKRFCCCNFHKLVRIKTLSEAVESQNLKPKNCYSRHKRNTK